MCIKLINYYDKEQNLFRAMQSECGAFLQKWVFGHKINETIIIIIIIIIIISLERQPKSGLLCIIMCWRVRMEGWYEDDFRGTAQAFRCKALPSHGLLCHMNLMRRDTARLLCVHKCINICLFTHLFDCQVRITVGSGCSCKNHFGNCWIGSVPNRSLTKCYRQTIETNPGNFVWSSLPVPWHR